MKKMLAWFIFSISMVCFSQTAKKPTIMLLPSDNWCEQRYYTLKLDNQGVQTSFSDYQRAFREDLELPEVVSKIGELLTDLGYSLKDAEREIQSISFKVAEDNNTTSTSSGSSLQETPLDILKRRLKSDIVILLWWKLNREQKGRSITFTIEAFDSYTNKRIATSTGTSKVSDDPTSIVLQKCVKSNIKTFDNQMSNWYNNQKTEGREIALTIRCWDSWDKNLETEYKGEELVDCIQDWLRSNTVNGGFNLTDASESFCQFEQVRIPLFDDNGTALDARSFATLLRKEFQKTPYNITSKVMVRGLGEAIIVLGEK